MEPQATTDRAKSRHAEVFDILLDEFENKAKTINGWIAADVKLAASEPYELVKSMREVNMDPKTILVVLVDLSTSMEGDRIHSVEKALKTYTNPQKIYDRIGLYGFNTKLIPIQPLSEGRSIIQEKVALCFTSTRLL